LLNKSAEITFYNVSTTSTELYIARNGEVCGDACTNTTSLNAGNVTFNVIGYGYANVSLYDVGLTNETQYITGLTVVNGTNFVYSPYDMNNDKTVNVQDLVSIATHYGETGTSGWIKQDVNKDGKISVIDMVIVSTHWGSY